MVAPDAAAPNEGILCDHEHRAEHIVAATVLPEFRDANGKFACPVMGDVVESAAEATGYYEGVRYYLLLQLVCRAVRTEPGRIRGREVPPTERDLAVVYRPGMNHRSRAPWPRG
jgi:hypothetical protein